MIQISLKCASKGPINSWASTGSVNGSPKTGDNPLSETSVALFINVYVHHLPRWVDNSDIDVLKQMRRDITAVTPILLFNMFLRYTCTFVETNSTDVRSMVRLFLNRLNCVHAFQTNLPPGQELQVNSSMRLGLWTPVSSTGGLTEIPISTLWRPSEGQFVRSFESDNFLVGEDYQFDSLEYPYDFRVDFCPYPGKLKQWCA